MRPFWANAAAGLCVVIALGHAPAAGSQQAAPPALELGQLTFVASEGTQKEVVLVADAARFEAGEKLAHLQNVHVLLFDLVRNAVGLDMRCERATINVETSDFDAEDNVRGITGDGRHFRTQRLRYVHGPGLVLTKAPVQIQDDAGSYTGRNGFQYNVPQNSFKLYGAATMVQQ